MSKFVVLVLVTLTSLLSAAAPYQVYSLPRNIDYIELGSGPAEGYTQFHLGLSIDLATRQLRAEFIETDYHEGDNIDHDPVAIKSCNFQKKLSTAQIHKIKSLLVKIKYCRQYNDVDYVVDPSRWDYFRARRANADANEYLYIDEFNLGDSGVHRWFCGNGQTLYDYLKKIVKPIAPTSCPAGYTELFKIENWMNDERN